MTYPDTSPDWHRYPAPAPQPTRWGPRSLALGVIAALALVGSVATAFVVADGDAAVRLSDARTGTSTGDHPAEWDERVVHLVEFVERERGLEFEHPVQVDFVSPQELARELEVSPDDWDDDIFDMEAWVPMMRALGLVEGDPDVVDTLNQVSEAGVLAVYLIEEKRVVVPGAEMTPVVEATLVHELTHALQDQHFDLGRLGEEGPSTPPGAGDVDPDALSTGFRALIEGDAMRIENAYARTLSPSDLQEYEAEVGDQSRAYDDSEGIPSIFLADFALPYVLGHPLVEMIAATGGNAAVDRAFQEPPWTEEHVMLPHTYLDRLPATGMEQPPLPEGVADDDVFDSGQLGPVDLYLLLAERIDPLRALEAVDGWGDGWFSAYEDGQGQVCVRLAVMGRSSEDSSRLANALIQWRDQMPEASGASVALPEAGRVLARSCDPGSEAELPNDRLHDVLAVPATRSAIASVYLERPYGPSPAPEEAVEAGTCFVEELGPERLLAPPEDPFDPGLQAALQACDP